MNIYVANIPFKAKDDDLRELFEQYGEVTSAIIIMDKESQRSRGFGFVEMKDDTEAHEAIKSLNGHDFMEKTLIVNEARPRRDNPSGERGGGDNKRSNRSY